MISFELELKMIESSEYIQDPCQSIKVLSQQCSLLTLQRRKKEIKIGFEKTVYLEIIKSLVEGCHLDTI